MMKRVHVSNKVHEELGTLQLAADSPQTKDEIIQGLIDLYFAQLDPEEWNHMPESGAKVALLSHQEKDRQLQLGDLADWRAAHEA